jgi:hypothetical protein
LIKIDSGTPTLKSAYSTSTSGSTFDANNTINSTSSSIFYADPVGTAGEFETLVQKTINSLNLLDFDTMKSKVETFFKRSKLKPKQSVLKMAGSDDEGTDTDYDTINRTMIINNEDNDGTMRIVTAKGGSNLISDTSESSTLTLTGIDTTEMKMIRNAVRGEIHNHELDTAHLVNLSAEDIELRLKSLDEQMEQEIETIKKAYAKKRAAIQEAIRLKLEKT